MKIKIRKKLVAGIIFLGLFGHTVNAGEIVSVDKNFASPIVPLSGYNKVHIQALDLSETTIISPPWADKDNFHWQVKPSNVAFLKKSFLNGVKDGLTGNNSRYNVVEKAGKGVLDVDVEIISFMPYAAKDDTEARTKGSGEFHISVQLRDGKSNALIHIFEGTVAIGSEYQPNTEMARLEGAEQLFHNWGKRLRKKLDEAS